MKLEALDEENGRDVAFIVLTSAGRQWTFRLLNSLSEKTKQELACGGLYLTRGTHAQHSTPSSPTNAEDGGEIKCFGCGWRLPGGERGSKEDTWERHTAAVGRGCKYTAARPSSQALQDYARQRDIVALQQLLLKHGKQLQAAEKLQDTETLEKIRKKLRFLITINKELIDSVPELKEGFTILAKHLVAPNCPRSHSSPTVSITSPNSSSASLVSSPSYPGAGSGGSYLAVTDYSPANSGSYSPTVSLSSSPCSSFISSNSSSWSTSSVPVISSDFYATPEGNGSVVITKRMIADEILKKQLMEYTSGDAIAGEGETETEFETETETETETDTGYATDCTSDSGDDPFATDSGDSELNRRGRPRYKEIDYHELTFLEKIGSGAFGTVWRGEWRGGQVAIKILHDSDVFNRHVLKEFRREAETMHIVGNHPNVVKFIGVCTKKGHFCIVSEFCVKGSLERLVRGKERASLSLKTIVRMARDAAAGILHLHCESVIHRDIAARNIMIGDNYSVHVGDFGFARVKDKNATSAFTATIGPAKYMAPEAIKDKKYSEKSDAFSFGVLLWEMLTGKEPWADQKSLVEIAIGVSSRGWRLTIPDDCPPQLADLMQRCWATEPKERPDFRSIHRTLNSFLLSLPISE